MDVNKIIAMFQLRNNSTVLNGGCQRFTSYYCENRFQNFAFMDVVDFEENPFQSREAAEDQALRKDKVLKEEAVTEIGGDRRNRYRYDIDLPVQYKVLRRLQVCQSGSGKTVNLSGGGIAVSIGDVVTPGSTIEL